MSNNIRQSNSTSFKNNDNESNTSSHFYPTKNIFELIVKGKLLQSMIAEKPERSEKSNSSLSVPNKFEVMYFLRLVRVLLLSILITVDREISYFQSFSFIFYFVTLITINIIIFITIIIVLFIVIIIIIMIINIVCRESNQA